MLRKIIQQLNSVPPIAHPRSAMTTVRMFGLVVLVCAYVITLVGTPNTANAAIPKYINFQGKLTQVSDGSNVANGTYSFRFKLYTTSSGGVAVWEEVFDQPSGDCGKLTVANGVFNAKLGICESPDSLADLDFTGGSLYLTVDFDPGSGYDGEMLPRKQLVSSAYSFIANGVSGDGAVNTTNSSATALTVANLGSGYGFQVDASTATADTGLKVTSANEGSGLDLVVVSSGSNESLHVNAKGTGSINIGANSTGNIAFGGGSLSTGCTVSNSTGAFACSGGGFFSTLALTSALTGATAYNGLVITPNTGVVTTGTWNATAIAAQYGGTGINTSASTGVPSISSGTWSVNTQLPVSLGGTGAATFTSNGVLYGNSTSAVQVTAQGAANTVLVANAGAPSFSAAITVGTSVTSPTINATTALQLNGTSINTAGTLTNVAYENQVNTFTANNIFQPTVTTGTGATAGVQIAANSLTTGNGLDVSSTSLTSGNLVRLASTSTAAASNTQTVLNIATSGANGTDIQTTYGAQISNTHTGTSATNVGLYLNVSGAPTAGTSVPVNYALRTNAGVLELPGDTRYGLVKAYGASDFFGLEQVSAAQAGYGLGAATRLFTAHGISANSVIALGKYTNTTVGSEAFTTWMLINNSGNVGIGDVSPAALFTVGSGDLFQVDSSGRVFAPNGASGAGNLAYSFVNDTDTGIYRSGVNELRVQTSGSDRITIDTNGGVGINNTGPDRKLDVLDASNPQLRLTHTDGTVYGELQANSSGYLLVSSTGNRVGIGTTSPAEMFSVGTASASNFNVNSSGSVYGAITTLNGSSTANGAGTASTSLIVASGTNFDVGNYVKITSSNCGGSGVNPCYAKITAKATNTLTISPALTWANSSVVEEVHIPEIGGTNTASTLANRYGRGYFIDGIVAGNSSTYFTDNSIKQTVAGSTFSLGDGNTTEVVLNSATTLTVNGGMNVGGTIQLGGGAAQILGGDGWFQAATGAAATPAYSFLGADSTGMFLDNSDSNRLSFSVNGVEVLKLKEENRQGAYVPDGSLCVDADGTSCAALGGTAGTIYASDTTVQSVDLAENYPSKDFTLMPGELVMIDGAYTDYVKRDDLTNNDKVIGVVSTKPGITLGGFGLSYGTDKMYPIALAGRVPVKVTNENGAIQPGDFLTSSNSIPGAAMRATKAGPVIGQALEGYVGSTESGVRGPIVTTGSISVFIKPTNFNGLAIEDQLEDLEFDYSHPEQTAETSTKILDYLMSLLPDIDVENLSQVTTDIIVAAAEVITPNVTTNYLRTDFLASATEDGSLTVASKVILNGGLEVDSISPISELLSLNGNVEFFGTPYFTTDTAGFAVVQAGAQSVDVTFEREYLAQPIVNASVSFEQDTDQEGLDEVERNALRDVAVADAQAYLVDGPSYVITNKSKFGFTIVLSKPASRDTKFSWTALAVRNATTFTSISITERPSIPNNPIISEIPDEVISPRGEPLLPESSLPPDLSPPSETAPSEEGDEIITSP